MQWFLNMVLQTGASVEVSPILKSTFGEQLWYNFQNNSAAILLILSIRGQELLSLLYK